MRKQQRSIYILLVVVAFLLTTSVRAEYVLPYPGSMPGSKFYLVSRMTDMLKRYWHWGSIASFTYHLQLSDKYLVEAKTLFEYQQYLLAVDALFRSNEQFSQLFSVMRRIDAEGKNTTKIQSLLREASLKHLQVLDTLQAGLPPAYTWKPEKQESVSLDFVKVFSEAKRVRAL